MNKAIFLGLVPILVMISGLFMYRFTGRRQILKLDLVQFFYAFVIGPVLFIWGKSFLFFLVRNELELRLSVSELFILDSIFSVLVLYIFAFVVIHSLTKSFDINLDRDPLYDLVEHAEYFHMELSHLAIYGGGMVVLMFISLVNVFIPMSLLEHKMALYGALVGGTLIGIGGFTAVWMYETPEIRFKRLMKVLFGIFFLIHVVIHFMIDPSFSIRYVAYWSIMAFFITTVLLSLFAEKPDEDSRFQRLPFTFNWRKPKFYAKSMGKMTKNLLKKSHA